MTIRRTLGTIILASALALGGTGCSDDGQNKSAQEYAQSAENRSIVHRVNADYNKAQYLQLIEIVENNKGAPMGALMGICMKELAGKASGKVISEELKKLVK